MTILARDHGVCLYIANSIIDPEKAGIGWRYRCCLFVITLSWQPNLMTVMKYTALKI